MENTLKMLNMLLLMCLLQWMSGEGCTKGLCASVESSSNRTFNLNSNYTKQLFNDIQSQATKECEGKHFYNYNSFIAAATTFPGFGATGTSDAARREVAAFFANVVFQIGGGQISPSEPES